MTKYFLTLCLTCIIQAVFASDPDSTVSITTAQNQHEFVWNSRTQQVEVKQKQVNTYTTTSYRATVPIAELYNDQITINKVSCKVDGLSPVGFKPVNSYYEVDDVFFSDARICYFPMVLDRKNVTGVVTFEQTIKDPRYFTSIQFSEPYIIQHKTVTIKVPRWMKADFKEYNFGSLDIKKTTQYLSGEDADLIIYTINNLPAMKHEEHSPGPSHIYPHLLVMCKAANTGGKQFTYFNTLDNQYAWYYDLTRNTVQDTVTINAKAREITKGIITDLNRAKAVYYWVKSNVRYIAFEDGVAGFKPQNAEEVLRRKYGDCKGMANLTKALLKALGYDARLCWLGTNHLVYNYETPSLAVDNHMICGLNLNGKMWYLDATETYLGLSNYAERIQGRQVLIENGDKYILDKIPVTNPDQNHDRTVAKFSISGNNLAGTVNHLWKGEEKEYILTGLNSIKQNKAEDAFVKFLSNNNSNYNVQNLKLSDLTDLDQDLTAAYDVNYKDAVSSFDKALYINLDLNKEYSGAKFTTRQHSYRFSYKTNIYTETELTIPENYQVTHIPKDVHITSSQYEFHLQYSKVAGKLLYKKTILIKDTNLPKSSFAQWNTDMEQLNSTYNDTIILKPSI